MNCSEFLAQLGDFLDNQVPTGLVADLQMHLDGCDHCVITLRTTQKTIEIYRNHEVYELPAGLRDRLQAAILARCTGPARFAATTSYIYATQNDWLARGIDFQQTNGQRIAMYPRLAQIRAMADGAGLTAAIQARGLTPAATDACFADAAEVDRIVKITAAVPPGVNSTPSFLINGRLTPPATWATLEPMLRAAGAK